jgi:hypothetical protein
MNSVAILTLSTLLIVISCSKDETSLDINRAEVPFQLKTIGSLCLTDPTHANFQSGTGLVSDPFIICTTDQWNEINSFCDTDGSGCTDAHFQLANNLDFNPLRQTLDEALVDPQFIRPETIENFTGHIDGDDYAMSGIFIIDESPAPLVGLINALNTPTESTIKNIKILGAHFYAQASHSSPKAFLIYETNTSVLLSHITLEVEATCSNGPCSTGIFITNDDIEFQELHLKINHTGNDVLFGGLIFVAQSGAVTAQEIDFTFSSVALGNSTVGGFVTYAMNQVAVNEVTLDMSLTGEAMQYSGLFGDISGSMGTPSVIENINGSVSIETESGQYLGALAGQFNNEKLISNINLTNLTLSGNQYMGGLAGQLNGDTEIENVSITNAQFAGNQYIGGLIGAVNTQYQVGHVDIQLQIQKINDANTNFQYIGGLAGGNNPTNELSDINLNVTIQSAPFISNSYIGGVFGNYNGSGVWENINLTSQINLPQSQEIEYVGLIAGYKTSSQVIHGSRFVGTLSGQGSPGNCESFGSAFGVDFGTTLLISSQLSVISNIVCD